MLRMLAILAGLSCALGCGEQERLLVEVEVPVEPQRCLGTPQEGYWHNSFHRTGFDPSDPEKCALRATGIAHVTSKTPTNSDCNSSCACSNTLLTNTTCDAEMKFQCKNPSSPMVLDLECNFTDTTTDMVEADCVVASYNLDTGEKRFSCQYHLIGTEEGSPFADLGLPMVHELTFE
jgi:hypothetical protein